MRLQLLSQGRRLLLRGERGERLESFSCIEELELDQVKGGGGGGGGGRTSNERNEGVRFDEEFMHEVSVAVIDGIRERELRSSDVRAVEH